MAARKNVLQDVSAASLMLHAQNFASALEKNVGLKLKHCIRYANIKVFSELHFPINGQNPRTYMGKYVSEKTHIIAYFTQSEVFH